MKPRLWSRGYLSYGVICLVAVPLVVSGQVSSSAGDPQDVPRLPDGRPDLNGTWDRPLRGLEVRALGARKQGASICLAGNCPEIPAAASPSEETQRPERPTYRPEFQARVSYLDDNQVLEDPALDCNNPGVPRIGAPDKIIQTSREVVFLYKDLNGNFFRIVPTDVREHRTNIARSLLGDSIGWWEGDALVVEATHFTDESWLIDDGTFHTEDLRVVERLTRVGDTITYEVTSHDPAVLVEPWVRRPVTLSLSETELVEAPPCVERDLDIIEDLTLHHDNRR